MSEHEHVTGAEARKPHRSAELDIEPEILLDVPLQARALQRLSQGERVRYRLARYLLASGGGAKSLVQGDLPVAGLGVYEALLARSWTIRFVDPAEMARLAEAAVEVALSFNPRRYGAKRVAGLQARAWGELANAYRVADRLHSAKEAFGRAYALLQPSTADTYLKARLFELEASLHGAWREFPLALRRLASLSGLYQDLGETHLAGRAMITRALYTFYSGETEEAVRINAGGLSLIDRQRDSVLYMMAVHNHLAFLVDLGHYSRAKRMLFESRPNLIYRGVGAFRFRGLEGQISYGLGELVSAEIAFREAKDGVSRAGKSFLGALLGLELAMVLMSQGRVEEAEKEVFVAREVFLSLEVYREFLGSIVFLEESFRRREATVELIEVTVAHLQRQEILIRPRQLR